MNLHETARLLTTIAAFNNRTIGEADVIAWQSVLADVDLADAEEAVRRHYAESTDWMMPAHVRRGVAAIADERARATAKWAPGQHGVPRDQAMPEISGPVEVYEVPGPVLDLITHTRAFLPAGDREALFPRRVFWENQQRAYVRVRDSEPNPLYRPRPVAHVNCEHDPNAVEEGVIVCPDA